MMFVGVDAGGTSSRCVAVDSEGTTVGRADGPGANVHRHGTVSAAERLVSLVRKALPGDVSGTAVAAAVCAAGLDTEGAAREFAVALGEVAPGIRWRTENDAVAAWRGAFGAQHRGVVVISGTGSAAYARYDGTEARAGGWGAELGDQGSGYDIGRRALIALLRHHDGTGPASSLREPILAHLGLTRTDAIIDHVHFDMQPSDVAALAPIVLAHARDLDPVAVSIIDAAAGALAEIAAAAARAVRPEAAGATETIPVSLVGGLSRDAYFAERVRWRCADPALRLSWHPALAAPVMGAVALARDMAGTAYPDGPVCPVATEG
jgi:N-acetylglucosamine kinase-like BadF-type ATPase